MWLVSEPIGGTPGGTPNAQANGMRLSILLVLFAIGLTGCSYSSTSCEAAAEHATLCFGETIVAPPCAETNGQGADWILAQDCAALTGPGGKEQGCTALLGWAGLCRQVASRAGISNADAIGQLRSLYPIGQGSGTGYNWNRSESFACEVRTEHFTVDGKPAFRLSTGPLSFILTESASTAVLGFEQSGAFIEVVSGTSTTSLKVTSTESGTSFEIGDGGSRGPMLADCHVHGST